MEDQIEQIRKRIIDTLKEEFPSKSESGFNWAEVEIKYAGNCPLFRRATLRRHLGLSSKKDSNSTFSIRYGKHEHLQKIEGTLNGTLKSEDSKSDSKGTDGIKIGSSNTSNLQGYYVMVSPSSTDRMLNLFPLKILPNGDFELDYIYRGDIIRGITSFSSHHLSLYSNRKFNSLLKDHIPLFVHSVFNVNASNSRIDLPPICVGLSTRRKRDTGNLKAVVEILVKVSEQLYNCLENQAYTLELNKDDDNSNSFHLLINEGDSMAYIDETKAIEILSQSIILSSVPNGGELKIEKTDLNTILRKYYPQLTKKILILSNIAEL